MENNSPDQRPDVIHAWNPLTNPLRQQQREERFRQASSLPMKPARIRKAWHRLKLWLGMDPIGMAFWSLAIGPLVAGAVVALADWPILGASNDEYTAIVIAVGSAAAFGSIVFSIATTLFTRAEEIAPGYAAVVLRRRSPWLSGLGIIIVSGLLFLMAVFHPTRSGAIASICVAVSAVTWSWMSARKTLADAELWKIAQEAGRFYGKAIRSAARHARTSLAAGWPRQIRANKQLVEHLTRDHQRQIIGGMLRQLRAGVRNTAAQRRVSEAAILLEGLTKAFVDSAELLDGEIGPHDDLLDIVLTATDSVIEGSIQEQNNEAGSHALNQLVTIGSLKIPDPEYAAARALSVQRLRNYLNRTWENNTSTIPAACVSRTGDLIQAWVAARAFEDIRQSLESLAEIGRHAIQTKRYHIGYAATGQLARLLPILAAETHSRLRTTHLKSWSRAVGPLMQLSREESAHLMASVTDALIPGISLAAGINLQQAIWNVPSGAAVDAARAVLDALEPHLLSFLEVEQEEAESLQFDRALRESMALAYAVTLLLAAHREGNSVEEQASRAVVLVCRAARAGLHGERHPSADVAEVAWSTLIAAAYAGVQANLLVASAETLIDEMALRRDWTVPGMDGGYLVGFAIGLQVVAGVPEEDIRTWEKHLKESLPSDEMWRSSLYEWGLYIEGLGRAPSANRNQVIAAPPALFDAINSEAIARWPRLASGGSKEPGGKERLDEILNGSPDDQNGESPE